MYMYEVPNAKAVGQRAVRIAQRTKNKKLLWALVDTLWSVIFEQFNIHWVLTVYDVGKSTLWGSGRECV